jgi:hypothetical protein
MSAVGRLWRRAPAWRLCVIACVASAALAAMFPPAVPSWWPARLKGAGAVQTGTMALAPAGVAPMSAPGVLAPSHFIPQPEGAPPDDGGLVVLHPGAERSGVIPFAGRQVPLPAGVWTDLVLARIGGPVPGQEEVLGRIEDGQLTGLVQASGPSPASGAAGPLARPALCSAPNTILRDIVPETPAQNPMVHECWVLLDSDATAAAHRGELATALQRSLQRVEELGAHVPDHMLTLLYVRTDQTGFMTTLLLLPDRNDVSAAASRRIQEWVRRYAADLHQAYDGKASAVARDPT